MIISIKLWCLYLVQHMLHQIKAPFRFPKTVLNPPVNGKIQGLFKAFEHIFQVLFKANLFFEDFSRQFCIHIQVLFKPVPSLL